MKKILLIILSLGALNAFSQVVTEEAKRKFTFGLDVFTDIWQDIPNTIDPKTINPGVNIFGSYNYMFGESNVSFSPGIEEVDAKGMDLCEKCSERLRSVF